MLLALAALHALVDPASAAHLLDLEDELRSLVDEAVAFEARASLLEDFREAVQSRVVSIRRVGLLWGNEGSAREPREDRGETRGRTSAGPPCRERLKLSSRPRRRNWGGSGGGGGTTGTGSAGGWAGSLMTGAAAARASWSGGGWNASPGGFLRLSQIQVDRGRLSGGDDAAGRERGSAYSRPRQQHAPGERGSAPSSLARLLGWSPAPPNELRVTRLSPPLPFPFAADCLSFFTAGDSAREDDAGSGGRKSSRRRLPRAFRLGVAPGTGTGEGSITGGKREGDEPNNRRGRSREARSFGSATPRSTDFVQPSCIAFYRLKLVQFTQRPYSSSSPPFHFRSPLGPATKSLRQESFLPAPRTRLD